MRGVIAAGHPQTAAAGAQILHRGGNAVDAAVGAAFASFIAEAVLVNIGGGGMAQVFNPAEGRSTVYDFFSTMPGLNGKPPDKPDFRRILVDFGPTQQPFFIGRASAAVPGVVAGLCQMAADLGRLPLEQTLRPAIELARQGVEMTPALAYVARILTPIFTDTPGLAAIFAPNGRMVQTGERLRLPQLADTLERLAHHGPDLFYTGDIARQIVADQQAHGGLITETDLRRYRVRRLEPVAVPYRGRTVLLPPPASLGGVLIAFMLRLLEPLEPARFAHNRTGHIRLLAEAMRVANQARAEQAADILPGPAQDEAVRRFLSDAVVSRYRQILTRRLADTPLPPDLPAPGGPSSTTHISTADADGMVVSVTTSAGECAGFVVGDTGITLNNMLGEIDLHPQGFHRLPPGQRLSTMMSPVIVLRGGQAELAVGSGGSNRLRTAITQFLSNVLDFGMDLQTAVDAPRVHFEEDVLQLEGGIDAAVAGSLEQYGYRVNCWPDRNMFFGGTHAVARQNHRWTAAGDARRGGTVEVVVNGE